MQASVAEVMAEGMQIHNQPQVSAEDEDREERRKTTNRVSVIQWSHLRKKLESDDKCNSDTIRAQGKEDVKIKSVNEAREDLEDGECSSDEEESDSTANEQSMVVYDKQDKSKQCDISLRPTFLYYLIQETRYVEQYKVIRRGYGNQ